MTISSASRKAGPFFGNGVTTAFPFSFKVFTTSDVQVVKTDANGVDSTLGLNADYSVSLNVDQNSNPGGTITYPILGTVLPNGQKLTVLGALPELQQTHITNGGNFFANTIEDQMDYLTILAQQLEEKVSRSILIPASDSGISTQLPTALARLGKFLRFDPLTGAVTLIDGIASVPLSVPVGVSQGGTAATTVSQALVNLGLIDLTSETTLTGGASLDATYLGKSVVLADSGAPANYTVNLPTAAPVGSLISIRVSNSATKLYTVAGVDFGIDGSPNRVLWRGETCLLRREAANWTKIGGRSIPFRGVLQRTAVQAIAAGSTWVVAAMQTEVGDPTLLGLCFDSVNGRFKAPRQATWQFNGYLSITATVATAAASAEAALSVAVSATPSSTPTTIVHAEYPISGTREVVCPFGALLVNQGQFVELLGRIIAGSGGTVTSPSFEFVGSTLIPSLSYAEVPLW